MGSLENQDFPFKPMAKNCAPFVKMSLRKWFASIGNKILSRNIPV
jgi:hypothetical protein